MERLFYAIVAGILVGVAAALWFPNHSDMLFDFLSTVQAQSPPDTAAPGQAGPLDGPSRIAPPPVQGAENEPTPLSDDSESYDVGPRYAAEESTAPEQPVAEDRGFPVRPDAESTTISADINQFESAQILARVGPDVILASEVVPLVDQLIAANKQRIPPDQVEAQRMLLIQQRLKGLIETRAVVVDARRTIPKEGWQGIQDQMSKEFEKRELPRLFASTGVKTRAELDAKLRSVGSSLETERRAFGDKLLARQWVQQQVKRDEEVPHEEIVAWYREHLADYELEAKARWEQLTVRFNRFPDKSLAYAEIARLGNMVVDGQPFEEVAKSFSDGSNASKGGQWDWTTQGSLVSTVLDEALFKTPVGRLSAILEDQQGFHIVRVIERQDAGRTPFTEAQAEIKKKIQDERFNKQVREYLDGVMAKTKISTIFDEPVETQVSERPNETPPR